MLYVFAGLPATGKSTIARQLAAARRAVYLRIDTIEQALRDAGHPSVGPEGYVIAYRLAADNVRLGHAVVADSVNPLQVTRDAWRTVAAEAGVPIVEIEIVCSDPAEHRARLEARLTDVAGHPPITWTEVCERRYDPWDTPPLRLDTAGQTVARSTAALETLLAARHAHCSPRVTRVES